nr:Sialic acid TRAP transporter large permease protein SiaM [Cupriavidus sp.]
MVAIGQFTPPLAVNLMVSTRMAQVSIESTTRWVLWLVLSMLIALMLLVAFPQIALWLPRTLGY